jgi:hypothetical protein
MTDEKGDFDAPEEFDVLLHTKEKQPPPSRIEVDVECTRESHPMRPENPERYEDWIDTQNSKYGRFFNTRQDLEDFACLPIPESQKMPLILKILAEQEKVSSKKIKR